MSDESKRCELCCGPGGTVVWESLLCRVVRVADPDYPGFCRVIWGEHRREMTDLDVAQRQYFMTIVFAVEQAVRTLFSPDKINLASFGNLTPHLHWHVIPRWQDDRHFPEPIWGQTHHKNPQQRPVVTDQTLIQTLKELLPSGEAYV